MLAAAIIHLEFGAVKGVVRGGFFITSAAAGRGE